MNLWKVPKNIVRGGTLNRAAFNHAWFPPFLAAHMYNPHFRWTSHVPPTFHMNILRPPEFAKIFFLSGYVLNNIFKLVKNGKKI